TRLSRDWSSDVCSSDLQKIESESKFFGSGLRYFPVKHSGNTNSSIEEADAVKKIVDTIITSNSTWIDRKGVARKISIEDILIIRSEERRVGKEWRLEW